jgi:betaine-aldehyde dehydrogenase
MFTERDSLLIGGRNEAAGIGWTDIINPSTEQASGRIRAATTADIDAAVASARVAFDDGPWPKMSWAERAEVILAALDELQTRNEEIATLVTNEMGAPLRHSVRFNTPAAIAMGRSMVRHAEEIKPRTVRPGGVSWALIDREPVGVVGAIAPWNGPFYFAILKSIPALLAGCTVVLKPALETPLDAFYVGDALYRAGLPQGAFSIVPGDGVIGEHLVRHPGVDKVTFTGSTEVGRRVGALCGGELKRCSLELGGKSAAVVLDDADADLTVRALSAGGFFNTGQVCAALTRVLVPRNRQADIVERLRTAASSLRVGDALDDATEIGPVVSSRQRDRVERFIQGAVDEGAQLVTGGGRPAQLDRGWFVEPTVFAEVTNAMTIAREEVFGPVVSVLSYDTVDEAVAMANDSPYGLHGAVFSSDIDRAISISERLVTGTVSVNAFVLNPDAPFGGRKASGIGREFGPEGLGSFLEYKSINVAEDPARHYG